MRPPGSADVLEGRRRRAIRLLESGESYRAVAAQVSASLSSVVRWHQAYRRSGREGLRSKPSPGPPGRLSVSQKKELVELLLRGALAAGYRTDLWTLRRVGEVIQEKFGIRYCLANVWKLMGGLGWSCQKPVKKARERDEEAIHHWKRFAWPHIKKRRKSPRPSRIP